MNNTKPAAAPDPAATAAAQAAANKASATSQFELNAVNQNTPQGSLNYSQTGTNPDGTPSYTATTTLSPEQQNLYNTNTQSQQNLANIGVDQSAKIGQLLDTPVTLPKLNTDTSAIEGRLFDLGSQRLDPLFSKQNSALETNLLNRGIAPGSTAYNNAHTLQNQSQNDAYNQLFLTGHGQAESDLLNQHNTDVQDTLTQRNEPLNEISALLSGSQVSRPTFTNTPTTGVAPTDYLGAESQSLAQSNVGYNAQMAQNTAMLSGLFGLGGTALGGWARGGFQTPKFG